jgi:hypothetical protein
MTIAELLSNLDTVELGEIMMGKAESLADTFSDSNIIIFDIALEELQKGNFHNMQEMGRMSYGDWDTLKIWVSKNEAERIKKQFDEDLKDFSDDEDYDVDDYSQIYSSFLYCKNDFVWGGLEVRGY